MNFHNNLSMNNEKLQYFVSTLLLFVVCHLRKISERLKGTFICCNGSGVFLKSKTFFASTRGNVQ